MSIQCTWLWTWYNDCCLGTFQDVICTYFPIEMLANRAYLWRVLKNPIRLKKIVFVSKVWTCSEENDWMVDLKKRKIWDVHGF